MARGVDTIFVNAFLHRHDGEGLREIKENFFFKMDLLRRKKKWVQITDNDAINFLDIDVGENKIQINGAELEFCVEGAEIILYRDGKAVAVIEKRNAVSFYFTGIDAEKKLVKSVIY